MGLGGFAYGLFLSFFESPHSWAVVILIIWLVPLGVPESYDSGVVEILTLLDLLFLSHRMDPAPIAKLPDG